MTGQAFLLVLILGALLAIQPALGRPRAEKDVKDYFAVGSATLQKDPSFHDESNLENVGSEDETEQVINQKPVQKIVEKEQVVQNEGPVEKEVEKEEKEWEMHNEGEEMREKHKEEEEEKEMQKEEDESEWAIREEKEVIEKEKQLRKEEKEPVNNEEEIEKFIEKPTEVKHFESLELAVNNMENALKSSEEQEAKVSQQELYLRDKQQRLDKKEASFLQAKNRFISEEQIQYEPELMEVEVPFVEQYPYAHMQYVEEEKMALLAKIAYLKQVIGLVSAVSNLYSRLEQEYLTLQMESTEDVAQEQKMKEMSESEMMTLKEKEKELMRQILQGKMLMEHMKEETDELRKRFLEEQESEQQDVKKDKANLNKEEAADKKSQQELKRLLEELSHEKIERLEDAQDASKEKHDVEIDAEHIEHILAKLHEAAQRLDRERTELDHATHEEKILKENEIKNKQREEVADAMNAKSLKNLKDHLEKIQRDAHETEKKDTTLRIDLEGKLSIALKNVADGKHKLDQAINEYKELENELKEAEKQAKTAESHEREMYEEKIKNITRKLKNANEDILRLQHDHKVEMQNLAENKVKLAAVVTDSKKKEAMLEDKVNVEAANVSHLEEVIRANKVTFLQKMKEEKKRLLELARRALMAFAKKMEEEREKAKEEAHEKMVKRMHLEAVLNLRAIEKRRAEEEASEKKKKEELKLEAEKKLKNHEAEVKEEDELQSALKDKKKVEEELKRLEADIAQGKKNETREESELKADNKDIEKLRHKDETEQKDLDEKKRLLAHQLEEFREKIESLSGHLEEEEKDAARDEKELRHKLEQNEKDVKTDDEKNRKLSIELEAARQNENHLKLSVQSDEKSISKNEQLVKEELAKLLKAEEERKEFDRDCKKHIQSLENIIKHLEASLKLDEKKNVDESVDIHKEQAKETEEERKLTKMKTDLDHKLNEKKSEYLRLEKLYAKSKEVLLNMLKIKNKEGHEIAELKKINHKLDANLQKDTEVNLQNDKTEEKNRKHIKTLERALVLAEAAIKEAKNRLVKTDNENKLHAAEIARKQKEYVTKLLLTIKLKERLWVIEKNKLEEAIKTLALMKGQLAVTHKELTQSKDREERLTKLLKEDVTQNKKESTEALEEKRKEIEQIELEEKKAHSDINAADKKFHDRLEELLKQELEDKKKFEVELQKYHAEYDTLLDVNEVLKEISARVQKEMEEHETLWINDKVKRQEAQNTKIKEYIENTRKQISAVRVGSATRSLATSSNYTVHIHLLSLNTKGTLFFIDWVNMILKTWHKDVAAIDAELHSKLHDTIYITHHGLITNGGTEFHYEWVVTGENVDTNKQVMEIAERIRPQWRALVKKVWGEYMKMWNADLAQKNKILTEQAKVDHADVSETSKVSQTPDEIHFEFKVASTNTDGTNVFSYLIKTLEVEWRQSLKDTEELLQAWNHNELSFKLTGQSQDHGKSYVYMFIIKGKHLDTNKSVQEVVHRLGQMWAHTISVDWDRSVDAWKLSFGARVASELQEIEEFVAEEKILYGVYIGFEDTEEERLKRSVQQSAMEEKVREMISNAAQMKEITTDIDEAEVSFGKEAKANVNVEMLAAKEAELKNQKDSQTLQSARNKFSLASIGWKSEETLNDNEATLKLIINSKNTAETQIFSNFLTAFHRIWSPMYVDFDETIRDVFKDKVKITESSKSINDDTGIEFTLRFRGKDLENNAVLASLIKDVEKSFGKAVKESWNFVESETDDGFQAKDKELTAEAKLAGAIIQSMVKVTRSTDDIKVVFDLSSTDTAGTDIFSTWATAFFKSWGTKLDQIDRLIIASTAKEVSASYSGQINDDDTGYTFTWVMKGKNVADDEFVGVQIKEVIRLFLEDVEDKWHMYKETMKSVEMKDYAETIKKLDERWLAAIKESVTQWTQTIDQMREKAIAAIKVVTTTPAPIVKKVTSFFL